MARRPGLRAAFGALLVACAASSVAGRVLLEENAIPTRTAEERRMLIDTAGLVLGLDGSEADAGAELPLLVGGPGEATWASTENPAMSVRLYNAGYDTAYGGSAVFTAPATGAAGTYAVSTELLGVTDSAWGDEFTAVAWYKASGSADPNQVLLQVSYASDLGDWGSSATWRVGGFTDKSQGFVRLQGFDAAAPWTIAPDCWQQLAVVKAGNQLTFYYNKDAAGNASADVVINDYGTSGLVLGVDYALLGGGGNATTALDPALLAQPGLGWLGGNLGMLAVYSRALDAAGIAAIYDEQQATNRFTEALCTRVPVTSVSPAPASPAPAESPGLPPAASPSPSLSPTLSPELSPAPGASPVPSPPPSVTPAASPPPASPPPGLTPDPSPSPSDGGSGGGGFPWQQSPPASPPTTGGAQSPPPAAGVPTPTPGGVTNPPGNTPDPSPSTIDKSTARVDGSGTAGSVKNVLQLTGGSELANVREDTSKQEGLKQAVLLSLNLDPSYTTVNIQINIINVFQRPVPQTTRVEITEWVLVCEYILIPTPVCPIEVLVKEEINVYLFIRVQQPVIPWWKGPTATVCQCDEEGVCHEETPPVPPPPVIPECSANICFLLDGSKSLINVDGWNDVVAAARSIMYSISSADAIFDVFWFSNEVERIGEGPVTGAQVAADNSFIRTMVNTLPNAHGTYMAQAISTCQGVLNGEEVGTAKTIVLITDGKPTDREATFGAADAVKTEGIKMVVVGAGDIDYETLKQLATGPSFTFANSNLNTAELLLLADLASNSVCRELD